MGIKIFDLPPNGLKDGAVANFNLEQSISTPNEVLSRNVEEYGSETKVVKEGDTVKVYNKDELGVVVRGEVVTEQTSPEDPPVRKYVQYDAEDRIVSSDPEGSDEFAANVGASAQIKASMKTMLALHMLRVELPMEVIDEINSHIDEDIIPNSEDASVGLVGQINQNEKSAQLVFGLTDEVGKLVKNQLDKAGKSYVKKGFNRDVTADAFNAWVVNSYSGDYNPLHSHGVKTQAGLSCILYLKVPEQIENIPDPSEESISLNKSSGAVDGFTYFTWGDGDNQDVNRFRPVTEEYVKPEVGTMLIFPNWLRHAVMPFYGDGERRTFSANMNIFEDSIFENMSEEDKNKHIEIMR
jgi:hypothetical protein